MENVTTSYWHAWINENIASSAYTVALHATGDVDTHSSKFGSLALKVPGGFNPMTLMLELKVANGIVPAKNPQVVEHSQPIGRKNPVHVC